MHGINFLPLLPKRAIRAQLSALLIAECDIFASICHCQQRHAQHNEVAANTSKRGRGD